MKNSFWKIFLWALPVMILGSSMPAYAVEALTDAPTGLVDLKEYNTEVGLYVPADYRKQNDLGMLIALPATSDHHDEIAKWKGLAEKYHLVVMVPNLIIREEDVPYETDEWLMKAQTELGIRYSVKKVFLVGTGPSAGYASYLGLKQPKEFAAVSSIGGSWIGPFSKLTQLSGNAAEQAPFFIAMDEKDPRAADTQAKAKEMTGKGYNVRLLMLTEKGEEDKESFRSDMLKWFQEQSAKVAAVQTAQKKEKQSFKQKFSKAKEEFFAV